MSSKKPPRPPPRSNAPLLLGLVGFTCFMATVPMLLQRLQKQLMGGGSLYSKDGALTDGQIRRGTYVNAGSKDIGADPDWDHKAGLYKGEVPKIMDADTATHTWIRPSSDR